MFRLGELFFPKSDDPIQQCANDALTACFLDEIENSGNVRHSPSNTPAQPIISPDAEMDNFSMKSYGSKHTDSDTLTRCNKSKDKQAKSAVPHVKIPFSLSDIGEYDREGVKGISEHQNALYAIAAEVAGLAGSDWDKKQIFDCFAEYCGVLFIRIIDQSGSWGDKKVEMLNESISRCVIVPSPDFYEKIKHCKDSIYFDSYNALMEQYWKWPIRLIKIILNTGRQDLLDDFFLENAGLIMSVGHELQEAFPPGYHLYDAADKICSQQLAVIHGKSNEEKTGAKYRMVTESGETAIFMDGRIRLSKFMLEKLGWSGGERLQYTITEDGELIFKKV